MSLDNWTEICGKFAEKLLSLKKEDNSSIFAGDFKDQMDVADFLKIPPRDREAFAGVHYLLAAKFKTSEGGYQICFVVRHSYIPEDKAQEVVQGLFLLYKELTAQEVKNIEHGDQGLRMVEIAENNLGKKLSTLVPSSSEFFNLFNPVQVVRPSVILADDIF